MLNRDVERRRVSDSANLARRKQETSLKVKRRKTIFLSSSTRVLIIFRVSSSSLLCFVSLKPLSAQDGALPKPKFVLIIQLTASVQRVKFEKRKAKVNFISTNFLSLNVVCSYEKLNENKITARRKLRRNLAKTININLQ